MAKKEFTNERLKKLNDLSDVELIEELWAASDPKKELIKALLDRRLKIVINDLKETTKINNQTTKNHNLILIWLTVVIAVATIVLLLR